MYTGWAGNYPTKVHIILCSELLSLRILTHMKSTWKAETCDKEAINTILEGLNDFNFQHVPPAGDIWTPLDFVIRDNDVIVGGILSGIGYWKGLEVRILWVKENYRNRGIGSFLIKTVEDKAYSKGATTVFLDTFDFQAEDFYAKRGYEMIGQVADFPKKGNRRVYFTKKLDR